MPFLYICNMKKCNICKEIKPYSDFVKRSNRASGRQPYCKSCHNKKMRDKYSSNVMKDYDLMRNYNITLDDYEVLFKKQNGCCAICDTHISEINKKHKKHLCVDHCHDTGIIRGLLCDSCNRGIGLLKDNVSILENALKYLKNKTQGQVSRITHIF